jgi:Spy/CpxP family protein refolding chaperone
MKTLKRILGVLLIFLFGVFVGAAVANADAMQKLRKMLIRGPEAVIDVIVKRLDRELKLDEEQKRRVQAIVDDARIQLRQSRAKIQPEVDTALEEAEKKTRAILYPEQLKKFDEIMKRGREKWKADEGGSAPPSPAPAAPTPATPAPQAPPAPPTP